MARLEALRRYETLDASSDPDLDGIAELAARVCGAPVGLINLVDSDTVVTKARFGTSQRDVPRASSFCTHAIEGNEPFVVKDALKDERFCESPLVLAGPRFRSYVGVPLIDEDRAALGTLCVLDFDPLDPLPESLRALTLLGGQAVNRLAQLRDRILLTCAADGERQARAKASDYAQRYRWARRAVGQREELLSIVCHDLKNPLSAIALEAGMLLSQQAHESRERRRLEAVLVSVGRMRSLIGDLLERSRVHATKLALRIRPHTVTSLVGESLSRVEPFACEKSILLRAQIGPGLPLVDADGDRVVQVLVNLIDNAVKFTPDGGTVSVTAARAGDKVEVTVADTGPGLTREQRRRVFDRFWQAQESSGLGTGLGLSIAKGIVDAHGERLWVESDVGNGSTFRFTLPVSESRTSG
ncbi:MAG: GAF domain-containing sensor histidine kinase [Myxococcota bacterium]